MFKIYSLINYYSKFLKLNISKTLLNQNWVMRRPFWMVDDSWTGLLCDLVVVFINWFLINFCAQIVLVWTYLRMRVVVDVLLQLILFIWVWKKASFTLPNWHMAFFEKSICWPSDVGHRVSSRIRTLAKESSFHSVFLQFIYLFSTLAKSIFWLTFRASGWLR